MKLMNERIDAPDCNGDSSTSLPFILPAGESWQHKSRDEMQICQTTDFGNSPVDIVNPCRAESPARMKTKPKTERLSVRLTAEQFRALEFLIHILPGRRNMSDLISQAVDEFTANRIGRWYEERKRHQVAIKAASGRGEPARLLRKKPNFR